ncbi:MAG: nuclear transport factor 2 family protein [Chloroflexi bacterium]|nr:nuclear transport factor 2 family protein [Chloroflexota bacterium]
MTAVSQEFVSYRWRAAYAATLLVALLLGFHSTAAAEEACPPDFQAQVTYDSTFVPSAVVRRLEGAWNADDASAALALFADDTVARSSSGLRWEGKRELGSFVDTMWDPNYASGVSRFETTGLCVNSERALWLFRYTQTGALGSVDLVVRGGQITHIFWSFTPAQLVPQVGSNPEPDMIAANRTSSGGEALIAGLAVALVAIGILISLGSSRDSVAGRRRSGRCRRSGTEPRTKDPVGLAER